MAITLLGAYKIAAKKRGLPLNEYLAKIEAGFKCCTRCKIWKPISEFARDSSRYDGHQVRCFVCDRVKIRKNRKGIPSPRRGISMSEISKHKMSEAHKGEHNHRWKGGISLHKKRDPLYIKARRMVNHAIQSGHLVRPSLLPCFICGNPAKEYHHHLGYSPQHWLDVRAVCISCHHAQHPNET